MTEPAASTTRTVHLEMTPSEADLLRTALRLLEDTLGREEADELEEVQALLARLADAAS
jgi:Arc/MetJ-type ribon-helix-helix transcriptional regulator